MMTVFSYRVVLLLLLASWGSCRGPCDPLVPQYCGLPFPNSFFTVLNSQTPTGVEVNFSPETFPKDIFGHGIDPAEWNTLDGFSHFPSIMAYFPGLSDSNLPPHWDIERSLAEDSPTVLLNAFSGEKLPHFAELDISMEVKQSKHALMIWPSQSLQENTQYIVALRDLKNHGGRCVQPADSFIALRDNISTSDPDIEHRRELFEDIFSKLEDAGVRRESLQLAWDFTTASLDSLTKRLVFARDDAFLRVGSSGPSYTIDNVQDNYSEHIYRYLQGTMTVPLYLDTPLPGSHLVINGSGYPVYQGNTQATFSVLIPHSVANGSIYPARIVQYGHGAFSNQSEILASHFQSQANLYGYVIAACDWWGMSSDDFIVFGEIFTNVTNYRIVPDRATQGMVNALLLMKLLKGNFATDPYVTFGGGSVIDPQLASYYGNSLGGILGSVYMAVTSDVTEGVLDVAGGSNGLLSPRNTLFELMIEQERILYPDPVDVVSLFAYINMLNSRVDTNPYISHITSNPLPGVPESRLLFRYALGDPIVSIIGTHQIARSAGAVMFESNVRQQFTLSNGTVVTEKPFGFQFLPDDAIVTEGSVTVGIECGAPPEPAGNVPVDPGLVFIHYVPATSTLAKEQMDLFMRTGEIRNVCSGPCTC